jgi:phosphatidylglycerophosphate synthase
MQTTERDVADTIPVPPKGDCYSAGERKWMEYGQELRGRWLSPLLNLLTAFRITPDHLTLLSFLFGITFAPLWYFGHYWPAVIVLWTHVALDGLDGPLARFQNSGSPRGSFTDSFCDQLVVSSTTILLMIGEPGLSVISGAIFLVVYTAVLAIAMVRNTLNIPYSWLLRPRLILFLAIPAELLGLSYSIAAVVWISNIVLGIKLATGFYRLRNRLPGPRG